VVGTTDQVAGEFAVDSGDLSTAQVGPILVNARTLATDNDFRNRATKNQILTTDVYEFITFRPSEIIGLTGTGTAGDVYNFQIVGDLTIRDVTRPVTFETTATAVSEDQLTGSATATVLYTDFDLFIPNSQAVASVEDEVVLEIEFVAAAKNPSAES
jgi:polyisoprenoid-binding protein YceI